MTKMAYQTYTTALLCVYLVSVPIRTCQAKVVVNNQTFLSHEQRLLHDLFNVSMYDTNAIPRINPSDTVDVTLRFSVKQIDALREKDQLLTITGWVETYWWDEFLQWDPSEYGGVEEIYLLPQTIWLPRWALFSSPGEVFQTDHYRNFQVSVYYDGWAYWDPGGDFSTICPVNIKYYPFDEQVCTFVFSNWAYTGLKVNLTYSTPNIDLEVFSKSGEWDVTETTGSRLDRYYSDYPDLPYPEVHYSMMLKRKPLFYAINVVLPVMLIASLTLLVFWLPSDSGEKMSMGLTILLSFSVFLLLIVENIPKTSESTPLIVVFLTSLMSITTASVGICVIVLHFHHYGTPNHRPPLLLVKLISIVYKDPTLAKLCRTSSVDAMTNASSKAATLKVSTVSMADKLGKLNEDTAIGSIRELLEEIVESNRSKANANERLEEWRAIARGIDRWLFWFSLVLMIVFAIILLGIYPNTKPVLARDNLT
ncbi:unnamed protein product [Owenia fusiformis]|uniref:Uncharacterized protein n=1 Tax=Owenia fusiformis TaxID=6347 RepID=A0A8J1TM36_OWEFU|nr:unnamed protein product [Owenia fusiformis]